MKQNTSIQLWILFMSYVRNYYKNIFVKVQKFLLSNVLEKMKKIYKMTHENIG